MADVPMDDEANFARRMAEMRSSAGMSQSELARQMVERGFASYSQMTVSRTEKGERPIRLSEARAIAELLGVRLDDMTRGTYLAEYVAEAEKIQADLTRLLVGVADLLAEYAELAGPGIDELGLRLSLLRDDPEVGLAKSVFNHVGLVKFPVEAVAAWAAEVAHDESRYPLELLASDVGRLRELSNGFDQAAS
jgi:transcriptional regulator with XRE-family HTH domain